MDTFGRGLTTKHTNPGTSTQGRWSTKKFLREEKQRKKKEDYAKAVTEGLEGEEH
jgi:hypothetical protein